MTHCKVETLRIKMFTIFRVSIVLCFINKKIYAVTLLEKKLSPMLEQICVKTAPLSSSELMEYRDEELDI